MHLLLEAVLFSFWFTHLLACSSPAVAPRSSRSKNNRCSSRWPSCMASMRPSIRATVDEAGFKAYVEKLSDAEKSVHSITDPAKLWVSSRDGQPYVIAMASRYRPAGTGWHAGRGL